MQFSFLSLSLVYANLKCHLCILNVHDISRFIAPPHTLGKRLIVCRTAFENFTSILETIGGPREKDIGRLDGAGSGCDLHCVVVGIVQCSIAIYFVL